MGDHARRPIHEELLSIAGIAGAEFEGDPATPEGVRVQLAPGADPELVGREVRRVLAGHGLRSQLTAPAVAPLEAPPPPEPRTVVNLADFDPGAGSDEPPEVSEPTAPQSIAGTSDAEPADVTATSTARETAPAGAVALLGEVVIAQRDGEISVSVTIGSAVAQRRALATEGGVDRALLGAVCELLGVTPVPELVSVGSTESGGSSVVSVLVDDGVRRRAGSAVSTGNRAWAVARAFWAALSGPA